MNTLFLEAGLLITGAMTGAILFFTFVGAPAAFRVFPRVEAGRYVRTVFPIYYLSLALTAAAAAMLTGVADMIAGRLLALVAVLYMAKRIVLLPRMERYRLGREAGDENASRAFRRLHGLSMILNLVGLVATLAAFHFAAT